MAWLVLALALAPGPSRADVAKWLGRFTSGPETIEFEWRDGGLVYHHGLIPIPVDGEWHVTVPEFHVRHRATWLAGKDAIRLEESHDDGRPWRHELRLYGTRLRKVSLSGGTDGSEVTVRVFERVE